jgi:hypothetical protein
MSYPYGAVDSVAVGFGVGTATGSVSIGRYAGSTSQGVNAIAIGALAGQSSQPANSIIINATGTVLNGANASALHIAPIRTFSTTTLLEYNPSTYEVGYSNTINSTLTVASTLFGSTINCPRITSDGYFNLSDISTNQLYTDASGINLIASTGTIIHNGKLCNSNTSGAIPSNGLFGGIGDRIILYQGSAGATPYSIGISANTLWYSTGPGGWHRFYSAVGIGTDPVSSALHINGSVLRMGILYEQLNVTFPEQIQWGNIDNRGYANITAGFNNIAGPYGVGGTLSFVTKIGNTVNASGIYINNGDVEIGTSSLPSTFSVNGTTTLKNTLTITNSSLDRFNSLVIDTIRAGIILRSPSGGSGGKEWNIWSSITSGCPYGGGAFTIYDNTSNLFRFSITSAGVIVIPAYTSGILSTNSDGYVSASNNISGNISVSGQITSTFPVHISFHLSGGNMTYFTVDGVSIATPNTERYYCIKFPSYTSQNWTPQYSAQTRIIIPYTGLYYIGFTYHSNVPGNLGQRELFICKNSSDLNPLNDDLLACCSNVPVGINNALVETNCSATAYLVTGNYISVGFYGFGTTDNTSSIRSRLQITLLQKTA